MNTIKFVKSLEDSGVLIDEVTETEKDEIKKQEGSWSFVSTFRCLISTASNFFSSKRYKRKTSLKSRKRMYSSKSLVPLHPLSNIKITNYFNDMPWLNGVFSRNILPRIKDVAYATYFNYKNSKGKY